MSATEAEPGRYFPCSELNFLYFATDWQFPSLSSIEQQPEESDQAYYARFKPASRDAYDTWLDFAQNHGAIGVGPATVRDDLDPTYSYYDMARPWMIEHAHARNLLVHVYTLDDASDFTRYLERGVDGIFTNNPATLLDYEQRSPAHSADSILTNFGY